MFDLFYGTTDLSLLETSLRETRDVTERGVQIRVMCTCVGICMCVRLGVRVASACTGVWMRTYWRLTTCAHVHVFEHVRKDGLTVNGQAKSARIMSFRREAQGQTTGEPDAGAKSGGGKRDERRVRKDNTDTPGHKCST